MSLKTHKATAKRFKISKRGTILKKRAGQDHFNAREAGKVTRSKRRLQSMPKTEHKIIRQLLPYS